MKNFKVTDKETNKEYWISRSMAVHAILVVTDPKENQVYLLLEQRGPGCPYEIGKWADPTGYLDWDETLKEAVIREVWEELGLDIKGKEINLHSYFDDPTKEGQNITLRFMVHLDFSEVKALLGDGTINTDTLSRGGEKGEVSAISLLKIFPREDLVDTKDFAFDHGNLINSLIKTYNNI